jgi:hypothetical protein
MKDIELSDYLVVAAVTADYSLKRARELLRLVENGHEAESSQTLCGAALICSIAYLAQGVEVRCRIAIAKSQAENGDKPNKMHVRKLMPPGLPDRMRKLAQETSDFNIHLDERKSGTDRLLAAIKLRNRLVHDYGVAQYGTADEFEHVLEGDSLKFAIPLPVDPWLEVRLSATQQIVQDVVAYLEETNTIAGPAASAACLLFHSKNHES